MTSDHSSRAAVPTTTAGFLLPALPSASRECRNDGSPDGRQTESAHWPPRAGDPVENHGAQPAARDTITAAPPVSHTGAECPDAQGGAAALRDRDLLAGARRMVSARELHRLIASGQSQRAAAVRLGIPQAEASRLLAIHRADPDAGPDAYAPRRSNSGRRPTVWLRDDEVATVRRFLLATNFHSTSGSTPHALRLAAREAAIRPELADMIAQRLAAGATPLPPAAMAQLRLSETVVRAHRSPRNAWLDYVSSPGSLQMTVDADTGRERLVQPGERWTIDDGSINLLAVVPDLERPGDKCWTRWGVAVGRFQLLLVVDHRTRFIVGWSFTARPRDSYRAEDIVATLGNAVREHGAPREIVLEHGVSAAGLVTATLETLGVQILRADSPHQKVVESVFHSLWTRLSTLPGQVGRFRGEEEAAARMLQRIRSGAMDPRGRLIELPALLAAIRDAVADLNASTCNSERCGTWTPAGLWSQESASWLRRFRPEDDWMFAPHVSAPIKVRGNRVETSWQPMPGWTVKLVFGADWLLTYHGVRVTIRYNAHAPECEATAILAEDVGTRRRGEILGRLVQIDRMARWTRRALGYGLDPDIGLAETRSAAQALRRHVAAVRADGTPGVQTHTIRTGSGDARTVETGASSTNTKMMSAQASDAGPRRAMDALQAPGRDGQRPGQDRSAAPDVPRLRRAAAEDPQLAEFLDD